MEWKTLTFDQLTTHQLFDLMKLRVDIFVVEQTCAYPELDEHDRHPKTRHLLAIKGNELCAYARLLAPKQTYPSSSIGRVVIAPSHRGTGLGHQLITQSVREIKRVWPESEIEIGAQSHLAGFYRQHGFVPSSEEYLEDGIPHIDMKMIDTSPN